MSGQSDTELPTLSSRSPETNTPEEESSITLQQSRASAVARRNRALVLVGCGLSQVPIWGFAMTYGIFQEYYVGHWTFKGSTDTAGIIGTTSNGVMYLSMPILFALFSRRWATWRRTAALIGVALSTVSFLLSGFSTAAWQLVITQGVLGAFGCALVYSPTTLSLSEHFSGHNRAMAYAVPFSCKNIVGSANPFLMQYLLATYGLRTTMIIWAALSGGIALLAVFTMPMLPPGLSSSSTSSYRPRKLPWSFLRHGTFWIYTLAIVLQSSGYGLPQTYLNTYANSVASVSSASSTLLITLFNAPGILSSPFFGFLLDNKWKPLGATSTTVLSAGVSAVAVFLLWGMTGSSDHSMVLLILFALVYGGFSGAYSTTWGGVLNEMEREAADHNEAIDTGMVYGLFNGARGIGYVVGGFIGVELIKSGGGSMTGKFGYSTTYGPLIVYTGLATAFGGWSVFFKYKKLKCW